MSDLHAKSGPVGSVRSRARASYATSFVPEPANISTFPRSPQIALPSPLGHRLKIFDAA